MKDRIRHMRKTLCKSQAELAAELSVSVSAVQKWESGENVPARSTIDLMCKNYDVDKEWLLTGANEMLPLHTRQEKIAHYVKSLTNDSDTDLQQKIILLMSKLPPETWSIIAQKAREVALEFPKDEKKE